MPSNSIGPTEMPWYPIKGAYVKLDRADEHLLCLAHWSVARGYVQADIKGERTYLHRLVLGLEEGEIADHRNLNGLDNTRRNLRRATKSQNGMNRGKRKDNTSGFKGVYFCRSSNAWRAEIQAHKVRRKLGRFATPAQAALVYDRAAIRYHGKFARTNFDRRNYF